MKKIFLLWSELFPHAFNAACKTWTGITVLHMQRFILTLYTSFACIPAIFFYVLVYYVTIPFWGKMFFISALVYLMRSSVPLKNKSYVQAFFSPELIVSYAALALYISAINLIVPYYIRPFLMIWGIFFYAFLYDYISLIPYRLFKSFIRACAAMFYNAPLVVPLIVFIFIVDYSSLYPLLRVITYVFAYPLVVASCIIIYSNALHNHYELYYAE